VSVSSPKPAEKTLLPRGPVKNGYAPYRWCVITTNNYHIKMLYDAGDVFIIYFRCVKAIRYEVLTWLCHLFKCSASCTKVGKAYIFWRIWPLMYVLGVLALKNSFKLGEVISPAIMGQSRQRKNLLVVEDSSPTSGHLIFMTFQSLSLATSSHNSRGNINLWDSW
jgi:hypothetical protein